MQPEQKYIQLLNKTVIGAVQQLFFETYSADSYLKEESLPSFAGPYLAQIALRSNTYQLNLFFGVSESTLRSILKDILGMAKSPAEERELAHSSLGELANTVACEMANQQLISKDFGQLLPTHPLIWFVTKQRPDFVPAPGISSKIDCEANSIYTHLSIAPASSDISDNTNWNPTKSLAICDPHQR